MNIIFFGSSHFAVPFLPALINAGHKVLSVVTQPDRKQGRGLKVSGTEVKEEALKQRLSVYQPEDVNSSEAIEFLKANNADLFVVVAYGQLLSNAVLALPKNFALNIHASLLPAYRGAAPINWAIINGENYSGVTVMKMARKMDAGPIILQEKIGIDGNDTALTLEKKLIGAGIKVLLSAIDLIGQGRYSLIPQDESAATFAPSLKKNDGLIDWDKPASEIYNLVRGCLGWPVAFSYFNGKIIKIHHAAIAPFSSPQKYAPGQIAVCSKDGIAVACGSGSLLIKELQPEGRRIIPASDFVSGYRLKSGDFFGLKK